MLLIYILLGALSGLISSTPLGPINLWVADHKLSKRSKTQLVTFLAAVILVDVVFATFALWGQFELLEEKIEIRWAGILSSLFTAILGLIFLYKANFHSNAKHSAAPINTWAAFLQGLILTGTNPAFLLFWLFVANQILSHLDTNLSALEITFFGLGVILGDILWFRLFNWILIHLRNKAQVNTLQKLRISVALIFVTLGLMGLYTYVFK